MRKKLFSTLAATAVVVSACGGGGGKQGEVADMFIDLASDEGLELDRGCVEDAADRLSDDDAAAIVEAGTEGTPDVSPEADEIGESIFNCVDASSFVDSIVAGYEGDDSIDVDCLRDELEGLSTPDEIQDKAFDIALACSG
ncbi:MAG: hypothetical protein R8G01_10020 [Ilumatobacteraceae bacterium]|nr:hypothetical protein [Ilumatobacteraceae bacterium]